MSAAVERLRRFVAVDPKVLARRMPAAGDIVAAQVQVAEFLAEHDARLARPEAVAR